MNKNIVTSESLTAMSYTSGGSTGEMRNAFPHHREGKGRDGRGRIHPLHQTILDPPLSYTINFSSRARHFYVLTFDIYSPSSIGR